MDVLRRTIRVSRKDRIVNEDIRQRIGMESSVSMDIDKKQLMWQDHIPKGIQG